MSRPWTQDNDKSIESSPSCFVQGSKEDLSVLVLLEIQEYMPDCVKKIF